MTMTSESNLTVRKNEDLGGIYEACFTIALPPITVIRYKADRNDFKYEIRRAVEEIVGEIVEKAIDD